MNNHLFHQQPHYYRDFGIRQFGYWISDVKIKPHQELNELSFAGSAKKLVKTFNKQDIPMTLFVIFTPGGVDFVGGYSYYQFLKHNLHSH